MKPARLSKLKEVFFTIAPKLQLITPYGNNSMELHMGCIWMDIEKSGLQSVLIPGSELWRHKPEMSFLHEDLILGVRTTNYKLTETEAARSILSFHLIMKSLFILLKS